MDIQNNVAVVSGGASGLGEAVVRDMISKGGKAAIFDFDADNGEKLAAELGEAAIFCKTDVSDEVSVKAAIDKTMEAFGAIHFAVNCAGVASPKKVIDKKGNPIPVDFFNRVLQINLVGTMNVIRLAAVEMCKNTPTEDGEKGNVINVASVAAFEGQVGQAAYSASKAAIVGMALPIAREFADYGIRVNTIAPGIFMTPMMAGLPENVQESLAKMMPFPKRLGKPEEFAQLVCSIIENPMINAEVIRLDAALRMAGK
ncbi:MAG: 3-hydroxyacyl-CoA dehydrogenase [Desulfobacteraceae bacterium]|jgi:3-hydroxyacyl-CoA dehydrogenase/3-hydroxy-2-methylbutyryl-CoA dehydrogenase|nr:3-hydroxyacyl-CoA dehydrogenase [Desulfobacteraceae bacterium]